MGKAMMGLGGLLAATVVGMVLIVAVVLGQGPGAGGGTVGPTGRRPEPSPAEVRGREASARDRRSRPSG